MSRLYIYIYAFLFYRETHKPALSANYLEGLKPLNSTVSHLNPCPPRDLNHTRSEPPIMSSSSAQSTIPISDLEQGNKECKYRGNSLRASAFRLVPAASVKDFFLKMEGTKSSDLVCLQPAPPAVQRTASRGQRGSRRQCVPQPDGVLSSLWESLLFTLFNEHRKKPTEIKHKPQSDL